MQKSIVKRKKPFVGADMKLQKVVFKVNAFASPLNKKAPIFSGKMLVVVAKKNKSAQHKKQNARHKNA